MPNNIIKSFAEKTGKSISEVDKLWNKAVDIVKDEYKDVTPESEKFYKLTTGVLKKMLSLESYDDKMSPILEDYLDMMQDILQKKKERIHTNDVEKNKAKAVNPKVKDTNSNYNDGKVNLDSQFGSKLVKYIDSIFPSASDMGGKIHTEIRKEIKNGDHKEHKKISNKVRDTVYKEYMKFLDNVEKRVSGILTKPR